MSIKDGWKGRFYEDFDIGDIYKHPLGRTVTNVDNIWFTLLTQNTAPIHFDAHYASKTEFKKPLVDSTFTVALVTGQSVTDISQNVFANLGWEEIRLPNPVFEGDTIYSESKVLESDGKITDKEMIKLLADAETTVASTLSGVAAIAEKSGDLLTQDLAITRGQVHEKFAWLLNSHIR